MSDMEIRYRYVCRDVGHATKSSLHDDKWTTDLGEMDDDQGTE